MVPHAVVSKIYGRVGKVKGKWRGGDGCLANYPPDSRQPISVRFY